MTQEQIQQAARAARGAGLDSFVRLAPTDYATVMRPLEAGAGGIMAAQVRSARQTEQIVQWAKFHPRGLRGINNSGIDGAYGTIPFAELTKERARLRGVVLVDDDSIRAAVQFLWRTRRLAIEPSGAATTAALLAGLVPRSRTTVLVVSGGNVDPSLLEATD